MFRRALLLNPPTGLYIRGEDRCQVPVEDLTATAARTPIDLAYVAADLERHGVQACVRDYPAAGLSWEDYARDLVAVAPDLVVVSSTSFTLKEDMRAVREAKARGVGFTVVKGAESAMSDEWLLENERALDAVLLGEVEETLGAVTARGPAGAKGISYRDGDTVVAGSPARVGDLDALPFPARHLLNNALYTRPDTGEPMTTVQTARGCPADCIFCLAPTLHGHRLRRRSPASVAREVAECVERFGIRNFFFRADTFTFSARWTMELCERVEPMGVAFVANSRCDTLDEERIAAMVRAGCWLVALGVESGSERSLKRMRKGTTLDDARRAVALCKRFGVKTYLFFVIGLPWETREDIEETIRFAVELDGDFAEFHLAVPFPGTPLHDTAVAEGLLSHGLDGYGHHTPTMRTTTLGEEELRALRARAVRRFYTRPRYVARTLARDPKSALRYARFGVERVLLKRP